MSGFILTAMVASGTTRADLLPREVPNAAAFVGWRQNPDFTPTGKPTTEFARLGLKCSPTDLFPTHPQQTTKVYHVSQLGSYDHFRLKGDDEACSMAGKKPNARGFIPCLRPDGIEYAVISDFYEDRCGNFYRGFWEAQFFVRNESMGTLFSRGRTLYPLPNSPAANDMYVADTYAVSGNEFLFFADVTPAEILLIKREKEKALRTHRFDPDSRLFILKKKP